MVLQFDMFAILWLYLYLVSEERASYETAFPGRRSCFAFKIVTPRVHKNATSLGGVRQVDKLRAQFSSEGSFMPISQDVFFPWPPEGLR